MRLLTKLRQYAALGRDLQNRIDQIQCALGRIEMRQLHPSTPVRLQDGEFRVYSQWGEDGIIQALLRKVPISHPVFVEFGVQDYQESNTRFLLQNDNWVGLVIDASLENVKKIKADPIYWKYNLKAECAFIDRDNINQLISSNGIYGDIGLLSIDIDGNDYWVWEAITCVTPRIVICEYNNLFGASAQVTIPYDPRFVRTRAHYSNLYWGASLAALAELAGKKGYALVCSNSAGNNAFFVRSDVLGNLEPRSTNAAWVQAQIRDSRTPSGELNFLGRREALREISALPVFDLKRGGILTIKEAISEGNGW